MALDVPRSSLRSPVSFDSSFDSCKPEVDTGVEVSQQSLLRRSARGPEVEQLQAKLREAGFEPGESGAFDAKTEQAVRDYQQAKGLKVDGIVGQQTWGSFFGKSYPPGVEMLKGRAVQTGYSADDTFEPSNVSDPAAASRTAPANGQVDTNHPWLRAMATRRLADGRTSSCVRTTLDNMARAGIPNTPSATGEDNNNARGAMVQLLRNGQWASVPLPGSTPRTIRSPYGTVQANVISAADYARMANAGEIPSGAIVFQTRHGWNYGDSPYGNDMGVARNGGRITHNYKDMSPIIYGDAREVVLLVPRDALR